MNSDEVNDISDTFESLQVSYIVKHSYFDLMSNRNWPHLRRPIKFIPYSNSDLPTHLRVDVGVKELCFINYDKRKSLEDRRRYEEVKWLEPDDFLRKCNSLDETQDNVVSITDPSGIILSISNDSPPQYYTAFDDTNIVFDSYDTAVDDTIQESKIQAVAYVMPGWEHTNDAVPDLPLEAFSALRNEAKSACFLRLKNSADPKAEQQVRKQQSWLSTEGRRINQGLKIKRYGRRSAK